jgi:hypothetical protein
MPSGERQPGEDELGPVDFLAVEFPGGRLTAPGFEQLLSLARQGTIRILDAEFVIRDSTGKTRKADVSELGGMNGSDLGAWAGASSGLLDEADVSQLAAEIEPGSIAAVIVYENRWILSLADAWRRDGARLIADGGIPAADLVAALDATEGSLLGEHCGNLEDRRQGGRSQLSARAGTTPAAAAVGGAGPGSRVGAAAATAGSVGACGRRGPATCPTRAAWRPEEGRRPDRDRVRAAESPHPERVTSGDDSSRRTEFAGAVSQRSRTPWSST